MKGIGEILKVLKTETVTGIINRIVVTLSMNMETTAVKLHNIKSNLHKFPLLILAALITH